MLFLLMILLAFVGYITFLINPMLMLRFSNSKFLVEKQFNYPIKQLQSDNGGEYCSTIFKQFLSDNGIFH